MALHCTSKPSSKRGETARSEKHTLKSTSLHVGSFCMFNFSHKAYKQLEGSMTFFTCYFFPNSVQAINRLGAAVLCRSAERRN